MRQLDFMIATGTHRAMSEEAKLKLVGITAEEKATTYAAVRLLDHAWDDPQALITLGVIPAEEIGLAEPWAAGAERARAPQPGCRWSTTTC